MSPCPALPPPLRLCVRVSVLVMLPTACVVPGLDVCQPSTRDAIVLWAYVFPVCPVQCAGVACSMFGPVAMCHQRLSDVLAVSIHPVCVFVRSRHTLASAILCDVICGPVVYV